MSRVAQGNGDDHADAALKHLNDCQALRAAGRYDGAGYLAGYVIECCLKTLIIVGSAGGAFGHDLSALSADAVRFAALPASRTAKYASWQTAPHFVSIYTSWRPALRYRPSGEITVAIAADWLAEAERVYSATVAEMRMDGAV
jgi:hypothetical protein